MSRRALAVIILLLALPIAAPARSDEDELIADHAKTLAKDKDPKDRADAARWLGGRKQPAAVAALAKALSDPDATVRQAAASALWETGKDAAAAKPELEKALDDPVAAVVARAAGALAVMGVPDAQLAPAWRRAFEGSRDDATAFLAARGLIGIDPPEKLAPPILKWIERNAEAADRGTPGRSNLDERDSAEAGEKALARLLRDNAAPVMPLLDKALRDSPESGRYISRRARHGQEASAGNRRPRPREHAFVHSGDARRGYLSRRQGDVRARGRALDPRGDPSAGRSGRERPDRGVLGVEGREGAFLAGGAGARASSSPTTGPCASGRAP